MIQNFIDFLTLHQDISVPVLAFGILFCAFNAGYSFAEYLDEKFNEEE